MKTFTKVSLIVAGVTTALGIIFYGVGMAINHGHGFYMVWDHGVKIVDNEKIFEQEKTEIDSFKNADIDVSAAHINFVENDSDSYAVAYRVNSIDDYVQCEVKDGKFIFRDMKKSKLNFSTGMNLMRDKDLYVTVYYPQGAEFGDIKVDSSAGDIHMEDGLVASNVTIDSSAGKAYLKNVTCALKVDLSAGSLTCDDCNFGTSTFDMSAGNINMNNCTLAGGTVDMSAGDFNAKNLNLTKSILFDMSAGDVDIELVDGLDIGYNFDLSAGTAKINGEKKGKEYQDNLKADIIISADMSAGSIDITNN